MQRRRGRPGTRGAAPRAWLLTGRGRVDRRLATSVPVGDDVGRTRRHAHDSRVAVVVVAAAGGQDHRQSISAMANADLASAPPAGGWERRFLACSDATRRGSESVQAYAATWRCGRRKVAGDGAAMAHSYSSVREISVAPERALKSGLLAPFAQHQTAMPTAVSAVIRCIRARCLALRRPAVTSARSLQVRLHHRSVRSRMKRLPSTKGPGPS